MKHKRLLLLSPLPPPVGGIATWTKLVMAHGVPGFILKLVNTANKNKQKPFAKRGFFLLKLYRDLAVLFKLIHYLFTSKFQIAHLNCSLSPKGIFRDYLCVCFIKFFRVPLISHYHGNLDDYNGAKFGGLSAWCLRKIICHSDCNIVLNQQSFSFISQHEATAVKKVVPNFVEDNIFKQQALFHQRENQQKTVVYTGAITQQKGCLHIIDVAKTCQDIKFKLIGDVCEDMTTHLMQLPKNVVMLGSLSREQVLAQLVSSDLFIFPSMTEGFPNAVLEAMAVSLPVIATSVGAIPEMIIHEKGGIILSKTNLSVLANYINKILSDYNLQKRMGNFNLSRVKGNYLCSLVIEELSNIYKTYSK